MTRKVQLTLTHLILGVGIVYLAVQIPEEGLLDLSAWIERRGLIPNFTATNWLVALPYFILALSLAFFIYRIDPEKFLPVGLGLIIWGLLDFLGFAALSLAFREYVPGLIAGVLYLPLALLAARSLRRQGKFTPRLIALAAASGFLIMALPMAAYFGVYKAFGI